MRDTYTITIDIETIADDESGFEYSLNEAVDKIKQGCYSGFDSNENEEYSFTVKKETNE
jgi:hypothetical protein